MNSKPEREMEFLLCCAPAFGCGERVAEMLRSGLDWDVVINLSQKHGVLPLIYRRLRYDFSVKTPVQALERLRSESQKQAVRNAYLTGELLRLLRRFESEGVHALPYKGPALGVDAYGDPSLRRFSDLDILIRKRDLGRVTELLKADGYECGFDLSGERERHFTKLWYVQPFTNERAGIYLEIHWNVAPSFFSFDFDVEELWGRTRRLMLAGREISAISLEDTLLLLCVHGVKDFWAKLEWICALDGFVRRNEGLDWDAAIALARASSAERMMLLGLSLSSRVCGTPLPPSVAALIKDSTAAVELAGESLRHISNGDVSLGRFLARTSFHLRSRERLSDRVRYCVRAATATSPSEWDLIQLPPGLYFLYALLRPLRRVSLALSGSADARASAETRPRRVIG